MAKEVSNGVKAFLAISVGLVALAFGIPSVIIGAQYSNLQPPEPCGAQSSPQLWTWLLTYGIVVLCTAAVQIISIVLIEKLFALYIVVTLLVGLFMFAWNIVGAVALFRDSPTCQRWAYDLWAMCLAVLIIQWVGMLFSCCSGYSLKDNNN